MSISAVSKHLLYFLENVEKPTIKKELKYDAVVVLAGMVNLDISQEDYIEFSGAVDRILQGIDIVNANQAEYLIISGGSGSLFNQDKSESVLLEDFAKKLGVLPDKILIDATSKNTYQNAVNTAKIITEKKLKNILLITSSFHMVRSKGCFQRVGIEVDLFPVDYTTTLGGVDFRNFVPSTAGLNQMNLFMHEVLGIIVYGITGKADYF